MKILQVAHSFLPHTMGGAEVYCCNLSKELAKRNRVFVFFRVNKPDEKEYALTHNSFEGLEVYGVNHTFRMCNSFKDTYYDDVINKKFGELLDTIKPDIAHIHHLLFLSHGIVAEVKKRNIPVVYSLHDYWLICYRGQLIKENLTICEGNSILECSDCLRSLLTIKKHSVYLYSRLRKRIPSFLIVLLRRIYLFMMSSRHNSLSEMEGLRNSVQEILSKIDLFLAPSHFIKNKFIKHGFPEQKIIYAPQGLNCRNFSFAQKKISSILRFAYLGTLLPTKGIDILIQAFKQLKNNGIELLIYGKVFAYSGFEAYPSFLKRKIYRDNRIKLKGGYDNKDVVKILSGIDILIVPSIWQENAPLIIQEAFLSKTPVIASRIGGIPELVADGVNGLLFNPRDVSDLQAKIQYIIDNPKIIAKFKNNIPRIKTIENNAKEMEEIYSNIIIKNKLQQ